MFVDARNIRIHIQQPETVKGKGLMQSYTLFTIHTEPYDWLVKRRYSDFEWFVKSLENRFSAHYVRLVLTIDTRASSEELVEN